MSIKIENTVLPSPEQWEAIIRGMRNPMNSWDRSDTVYNEIRKFKYGDNEVEAFVNEDGEFYMRDNVVFGPNDLKLMESLAAGGPVHAKYRRMTIVFVDITAPLYWWKEFDTYKVGTVANSCSTMHKIHSKEFEMSDFSCERMSDRALDMLASVILELNYALEKYLETKDKQYWEDMIQLLPTSYNQKRTVLLNYEVLAGIYPMRKNHKLREWHDFCDWIKTLPESHLITGECDAKVTYSFKVNGNIDNVTVPANATKDEIHLAMFNRMLEAGVVGIGRDFA